MSEGRASIFDDEDLDLADFTPKKADSDSPKASIEEIKTLAAEAKFPSRESTPLEESRGKPRLRRKRFPHHTGRTSQFNVKLTPETIEQVYRISDDQGWVLGETIERAMAALEREIEPK